MPGILRQQPPHREQQDDDRRRVHQEDRPPADERGEDPAEHDPRRRPRGGGALVDAERPGPARTVGVQVSNRGERHRGNQRGARALREPRADQQPGVPREPGGERRHPEQREPAHQQPPVPGQVADPPAEQQQRAERQRVPGDDPLQVRRGHAELALDRRERDVDDRKVQLEQKLSCRHQEQRQPERPCRGRRANRDVVALPRPAAHPSTLHVKQKAVSPPERSHGPR